MFVSFLEKLLIVWPWHARALARALIGKTATVRQRP